MTDFVSLINKIDYAKKGKSKSNDGIKNSVGFYNKKDEKIAEFANGKLAVYDYSGRESGCYEAHSTDNGCGEGYLYAVFDEKGHKACQLNINGDKFTLSADGLGYQYVNREFSVKPSDYLQQEGKEVSKISHNDFERAKSFKCGAAVQHGAAQYTDFFNMISRGKGNGI